MPISTHQFSHYNTTQLLIMMDPPRSEGTLQGASDNRSSQNTCRFMILRARGIYPGPWNGSECGDALKVPCIIFSEEEVGKAGIINHAVIHYRAPTQCWHRETALLHFAITRVKGNLMDATWCKVNKVDMSDVRRDVCCDISILNNI